jgi:hypothetical protein
MASICVFARSICIVEELLRRDGIPYKSSISCERGILTGCHRSGTLVIVLATLEPPARLR